MYSVFQTYALGLVAVRKLEVCAELVLLRGKLLDEVTEITYIDSLKIAFRELSSDSDFVLKYLSSTLEGKVSQPPALNFIYLGDPQPSRTFYVRLLHVKIDFIFLVINTMNKIFYSDEVSLVVVRNIDVYGQIVLLNRRIQSSIWRK